MCVLLYIRSYSGLATKIFITIATVKIWQLIKEIDEMHASCPVTGKLKHPNKTLHRSWNWTVRWMHCIWLTYIWPWTDLDIRELHKTTFSSAQTQAHDVPKVLMKFEILMFVISCFYSVKITYVYKNLKFDINKRLKLSHNDLMLVQKGTQ